MKYLWIFLSFLLSNPILLSAKALVPGAILQGPARNDPNNFPPALVNWVYTQLVDGRGTLDSLFCGAKGICSNPHLCGQNALLGLCWVLCAKEKGVFQKNSCLRHRAHLLGYDPVTKTFTPERPYSTWPHFIAHHLWGPATSSYVRDRVCKVLTFGDPQTMPPPLHPLRKRCMGK